MTDQLTDQQQQLFDFVMARLREGQERPAKALFAEMFSNLHNTAIGPEYFSSFRYRLTPMIQPQNITEVRTTVDEFVSNRA